MTIASTPRKAGPFSGTGVQTDWPFAFKVFSTSNVKVITADAAGVETVRTLDTDYTVALNPNQDTSPGGTVTYPISGSPLPVDGKLSILGNVPYDQPLDIPSGGNFNPLALENQLDRATMQIQQLAEEMDRTLKASPTQEDDPSFIFTTYVEQVEAAAAAADEDAAAAAASANEAVAAKVVAVSASATAEAALAGVVSNLVGLAPGFYSFSGTGAQVDYTLPAAPPSEDYVKVRISGVWQNRDSFSVAGTTLTFTAAPPAGVNNIEIEIAPNIAFVQSAAEDWGLITASPTADEDYGALV